MQGQNCGYGHTVGGVMSKARHAPVNMMRWLRAQQWTVNYWCGMRTLKRERKRLKRTVMPIIQHHCGDLQEHSHVLDLGCGPTCVAQYIEKGKKTYVDSLLNDYRRAYPGQLPQGNRLCIMAENIPLENNSMDMILCINALDHMQNPELVLSEMHRIIKPGGLVMISMFVYPVILARLYYTLERVHLALTDRGHPYNYSLRGIRHSLQRHFQIKDSRTVRLPLMRLDLLPRQYYMFVCEMKKT